MSLSAGSHVGAYEVTGAIGAGGMGEVYRARDTSLNRDVAIKVLPDAFANDPERLARFTREAQTLAALNHPNIAQIYGLETAGSGARALVMELVDGEDLSALIARGPVPMAEALAIARQIADALETAHEQGIIHRDLKPANVKVRTDGTVKVLDFGLAKALAADGGSAPMNAINSPTFTAHATQMGMIIGTAAYMAPEQARGKAVDKRADIWAFGVVLFEMLTGRRAFAGDDTSDVLASVLKSEPEWSAVPADTPASVRRLLRRCLEKEPRKRLSAIGDARLELDEKDLVAAAPVMAAAVVPRPLIARIWPAAAAVAVTLIIAALAWPSSPSAGDAKVTRLSVLAPPGLLLYPESSSVAISPDGTMVAFVVSNVTLSESQLWVRSLDSMTSRRLEGADESVLPFWSPDSKRIGFFTNTHLKTIAASGGRADVVCEAPEGRGAIWTPSNVIVFAPDAGGPLVRVAASGGTPTPATTLDASRKEFGHRFPTLLPDGKHFLYAALPGKAGQFDIFSGSLDDSARTFVGTMDSAPQYAAPGWLLYSRQGVLAALPFDAATLKITGESVSLPDEPASILDPSTSMTAGRSVSVSNTGAFSYFSAPSANTIATWYDAQGRSTGTLALPAGHYESVSISPDGTRAVLVRSTSPSDSALWLVDLGRGSASPLTSGRGRNDSPVWSPDGRRVVFSADRDGLQDLFVKEVGDATPEAPLYRSNVPFKNPSSWSPDSRWIVTTQLDPDTSQNVYVIPADGRGEPRPVVRNATRDRAGPVSPGGRWLAYVADQTGRYELYVQAFPEPAGRVQVSQRGATLSWWTRDGRELLFLGDDLHTLWRVDVQPGATLQVGTPRQIATFPPSIVSMDATPDRTRFLAISPERTGPGSLTVVLNWLASVPPKSR